MVRYPPILIYISLFTIWEHALCENVVKNEIIIPTITTVDIVRAITPWWRDIQFVSNLTLGCGSGSNNNSTTCGGIITTVKYNVTKRLVITSTTYKPKTTKPPRSNVKNPKFKNMTVSLKLNKKNNSSGTRKSLPSTNRKTAANIQIITTNGPTTILVTDFKTKYPITDWKVYGFYTDDYMRLINNHWFKFEPPNTTSHYILGILYTVIMMFGCFGNSLVIFMYTKCKSLQTPANVLIMNLAVSDFIMLAKTPVFIYNSYYQGPALGKLGCQIYGFFGGLTGTVSIMTLAAISLDRYYVIVHPLNAAVKTTKQRARIWIGLIWMYGFMFSMVPVLDLGYNRYVPEGYLTSCSFDYLTDDSREKGFILVFFAAAWCVPFTAISYCYVKILMAVWMTNEIAASSRFGQEEEKRKTEIRLGYVVVGVIFLWFISWTPYAMVALLGVFDQKEYITPLGSMIPALFCKAASSIDPWIYAITHPRFKIELNKLLSKKQTKKLDREYVIKKGWDQSYSTKTGIHGRNHSSTEDEDVEEVIVMVNPDDGRKKTHRQESTSSHKTEEIMALETKFPLTRQESLKYMPPSWYELPRTSSKSSIKLNSKPAVAMADNNKK